MSLAILLTIPFVLTSQETRRLTERYNQIQVLIADGEYERAIRQLQGLIREFGESEYGDELRYTLAECYFNQGNYQAALKIFQYLFERHRYSYIKPEAMYGAVLTYIMMGNFRQAQVICEKLLKEPGYENNPRANFALGILYYFQHSYEQARAKLEMADLPEAKLYLGKTYAKLGKPLLALLKFKEVSDSHPATPLAEIAHFEAGLALFLHRDYDGARAKFGFFLERFSHSPFADYAHYFLACALIAQKEYPSAIEHLLPLTRASNNFLAAHANYFIAYAEMALGRPEQAVERFQKVRSNYPRSKLSTYAHLQLAQAMLASADTAQAILTTSQLARMFTSGELSGVGFYFLGSLYYQTGNYDEAIKQFEKVLIDYGTTAFREPAAAMLLLTLNTTSQFEKAMALGTKHVIDYPDDTTCWRTRTLYFLAEAFYYAQKYREAEQYYQESFQRKNDATTFHYAQLGRAYCLYHLNRLSEATDVFKILLTSQLNDTFFTISAYLGYGYSLFNKKEYLKALDVFEALTNTFPDIPSAAIPGYFYAGYCYYQLKYYGQAVDAWTALINKYPSGNLKAAEAAFRTGDTYFKALEYDKAIAAFQFVIERYPFSSFAPASQALIAQCYYNRRQFLDAIREYQKFLDIYPSDRQAPSVRKSLEMAYYLASQEDTTLRQEFLKRFPESELAAEGYFRRGKELFDAGRYDEAIIPLQQVVVNSPNSAVAGDAQLLTAEAYAQLKRWSESAQAYQKFLDYFPKHDLRSGAFFNQGVAYFNAGEYNKALASFQMVVDSFPASEYVESARKNLELCRQRLGATGSQAPDSPDVPAEKIKETKAQGDK